MKLRLFKTLLGMTLAIALVGAASQSAHGDFSSAMQLLASAESPG